MPDVVGQVKLIQGTDLQNPRLASKIVVGLLLNSFRTVRLVISDNASSLFRDMYIKSVIKYRVILITSVNPRLIKGKLTLTTTTATRFYHDSSIDPIQQFIRKYEVGNHS
ncbi:hypothetical protein HID58_006419 [Brassica napus]|uniref:DUF659 domain-containing protein n=1 Tax=Brassica napus TaxID=3708 RepID=A0ABQ8EC11_BRANA|nr:hypothetical protein HID58_006419 [Brassica napus]